MIVGGVEDMHMIRYTWRVRQALGDCVDTAPGYFWIE